MFKPTYQITFIILLYFQLGAQTEKLAVSEIKPSLLENANSVVRLEKQILTISDRRAAKIETTRIVTVLNKLGENHIYATLHYDKVTRIEECTATIYDKYGKEVKRFKKRNFKDESAVDSNLFTDSRVMYLDYTPIDYPYTVILKSVKVTKNTAFLPSFYSNAGYLSSTEKGYFEVNYKPDLGLRSKINDSQGIIEISDRVGQYICQVNNVQSIRHEPFSPGFQKIVANVKFALDYFHLEGVDGEATTWKAFGAWVNEYLLKGTQEISEESKNEIKNLVSGVDDKREKVELIYEFMQGRTRYISVQVGIGGWKPMPASDVDELAYGDCKALSNYTRALLAVAGIPSYYTILYGGYEKRNIENDFPSIHGNHVILAVPFEDDFIWLECTDQNIYCGHIANFTDDRDVLLVTPEGGEIVHTKRYKAKDNTQSLEGDYSISANGDLKASLKIKSRGTQYGDRYRIENYTDDERIERYYEYWDYINNISFQSIDLTSDKKKAEFSEDIVFTADNYAVFAGNEMIVTINAFNRFRHLPSKNKNRKHEIEIDRGFQDIDEVKIAIPEGWKLSGIPSEIQISNKYGNYNCSVTKLSEQELLYKRSFTFFEGLYNKSEYIDFRNFLKEVAKADNQKIVLHKIK